MNSNELKIIDLCGRLPYGVMVQIRVFPSSGIEFYTETLDKISFDNQMINGWYDIDIVKPYLRPMDSMTEAERKEWNELTYTGGLDTDQYVAQSVIDWLHAHHFDYKGLIPKGLATEAPEGMYDV